MTKILYKCCICGRELPDRTKMRRLVSRKWNTKGYGCFTDSKHFDLCNYCYMCLLNKMNDMEKESKHEGKI